ncbi:MAG: hypothetical protein AB7P40_27730 [Chloroflexota bacterium]
MARIINSLLTLAVLIALVLVPVTSPLTPDETGANRSGGLGQPPAAYAQGSLPAIPSVWPSNLRSLQLGRASFANDAANLMSRAPFGFRYQYLSAGVNTGNGWANWNQDGHFVTYYIQDSVANSVTPVFTYYQIYQSSPGGGSESQAVLGNLNNTSTMQAYYADLKLFFQRAGAFPNNKVVLHVEPDMWGYVQQAAGNDNATSVAAKVASTGVTELAGLPDNVSGLAKAIVRLRDTYAPNVILGYHLSDWGTGTDISLQDPSNSQVDQLGDRAGNFYNSLGANFDVAFSELGDRDAGFDQAYNNMGPEAWWDDADFTRHARFLGRFVATSGKRMVLWQIPLGNTRMRAMNNTNFHFQDNRVEKLLDEPTRARLQTYVDAGVMAFLFGAGHYWATSAIDAANDGVTNPAAINGNNQTSYNSDDDGGYFHNRAAAYYTTGAMSIPGGVSLPPTVTPTPTATPNPGLFTPTPVVPPGSYTLTATASQVSVAAGSSTTITATIASGNAGSYLVDIEAYPMAGGNKVLQEWFDNQPFAAGQHRTYQTTWNVPANTPAGTYVVMLGLFSPGWVTNYAWNSNAVTLTVTAAGSATATLTRTPTAALTATATRTPSPTATPVFTATPTATLPPVACSPRPPISLLTTPVSGSLRVDLSANGTHNRLLALQFTQTTNALVDANGQNGLTGAFTVNLSGSSNQASFNVRRASAGAATAMLTVVDRCGSWSTFVGGGPTAW